jgi:hypothetical protein
MRFDPTWNKVYIPHGSIWQVYPVSGWTILYSQATNLEALVTSLPLNCWVGNGRISASSRILTTGWSLLWQEPVSVPASTVTAAALALPAHLKWALETITLKGTLNQWVDLFTNHDVIAVADGSFQHSMGTSAFIMTTLNPACPVSAIRVNRVPGLDHSQAAYRSEVAGILGILILCKLLTTLDPRIKGHLVIGCDNQEAGRRAITFQQPPRPTDKHFDLLFLSYTIHKRLATSWSFQYHYVEGHQRKKYGSNRNQWGILNDQMDSLAKAYLVWCTNPPLAIITPPWSIQIADETISCQFKAMLCTWVQHQKQLAWWYQTKKIYTTPSASHGSYCNSPSNEEYFQGLPLLDLQVCHQPRTYRSQHETMEVLGHVSMPPLPG